MKVERFICDCCGKEFSKNKAGFGELDICRVENYEVKRVRLNDLCETCMDKLWISVHSTISNIHDAG